jgi:Cu2+-exporting ATPase
VTDCAHCGLPLGRRPVEGTVEGARVACCCFGCLLALQVTRARGEPGAAAAILVRLGLAVFFAMNVMMLSLPTYAPYVYGAESGEGPLFAVLRVLAMLFTAPVLVLLGGPILAGAWAGLRAGGPNSDALIVLGTLAAYGLSVASTLRGGTAVYFDTAAMLLVLVTLGRFLEARARAEAGAAVRATLSPAPALATRLVGETREAVPPDLLAPGERVEVGPGAAFPTDGVIAEGEGSVDEAALTGESAPVPKAPGSRVAGGTCSVDGIFEVTVTAPARESAGARIAALVEAARRERSPAERAADRVVGRLVPAVVLVALGAGGWWTWRAGLDRGVLTALAVLVVACPCALGIATPVAVWAGLAAAARRGVVVRSAAVLERLTTVRRVLFDKTGTLTGRTPRLAGIEVAREVALSAPALLARAAALESRLDHPVARVIRAAAGLAAAPALAASAVRVFPGRGVRGLVAGEPMIVGSARFVTEATGVPAEDPGAGAVVVAAGDRLLGVLRFAEALRPGAAEAVAALRRQGMAVGLLSGDAAAAAVVPAVMAPEESALGLAPEGKVAAVRAARRVGPVAMVGDGANDAPALAAADVGIAVASATDLARLTADVVVLGGDLGRVPWLLALARRVVRVARQNLCWAFGYNAIAVALAACGRLDPLVASAAMVGSSLLVVANARRLARRRELS